MSTNFAKVVLLMFKIKLLFFSLFFIFKGFISNENAHFFLIFCNTFLSFPFYPPTFAKQKK